MTCPFYLSGVKFETSSREWQRRLGNHSFARSVSREHDFRRNEGVSAISRRRNVDHLGGALSLKHETQKAGHCRESEHCHSCIILWQPSYSHIELERAHQY